MSQSQTPRPGRTALRVGGAILLAVGLVLTIMGMADFFDDFGDFSAEPPGNFWMAIVGLPLVGIGAGLLMFGFMGAGASYVSRELRDPVRETLDHVVGPRSDAAPAPAVVDCPQCHRDNPADARFCAGCGAALA